MPIIDHHSLEQPLCLIIDDEPGSRFISAKIVSSIFDCRVKMASSAIEALDLCARELPKFIILDWHMPEIDGLGFIHLLKRERYGYRPKIIMCTAECDEAMVREAMESGISGYITKPFSKEGLVQQLKLIGMKLRKTQLA